MLGQEQRGQVKHNWWTNSVRRFLCRNSPRRSESKLGVIVQNIGLILLFLAQYFQIMLQWQQISNSEQTFSIMNACVYVSLLMFLYGRDEELYLKTFNLNGPHWIRISPSSLKKTIILLTAVLLILTIAQVVFVTKKIINLESDIISTKATRDVESTVNQNESTQI